MKFLSSLKYRIAVTIFVLELVMLSVVLWQTLSLSYERSQTQSNHQDETILELLAEVSHTALFTSEFADLRPYFKHATQSQHIELIYLLDFRDIVVASSHFELMGKSIANLDLKERGNSYWKRQTIGDGNVPMGQLGIRYSDAQLRAVYEDTLKFAFTIALSGMLLIAAAGIFLGHLLTRRLNMVIDRTQRFANGQMDSRCPIKGKDEVAQLGQALNSMADQVSETIDRIEHMAFHDVLTGLSNRRMFNISLAKAITTAKQDKKNHCLMYLDLDQFKVVNDTCGHDAGDRLLKELSATLRRNLRENDLLARLGGDEFGVLIEHCSVSHALPVAQKLLDAVRDFKFTYQGKYFDVGVSIGLVLITENSIDSKHVMSAADTACYAAKKNGRNTLYTAEENDEEVNVRSEQTQWFSLLTRALKENEFFIVKQHIGELNQPEKTFADEYLLRLNTESGETFWPQQFLPSAERYRLMPEIDRHVIRLVFAHLSKQPASSRLSFINLSGASLDDPEFIYFIQSQFDCHDIDPQKICFEITETVAIDNFNNAITFINAARKIGCLFALDDFGSGMCSFTYLKSLPVDFVKIDGSFIVNMLHNPMDHSIVSAISNIAQQAGFKTIAEYVEDEKIIPMLAEIGIDYIQGHVIHRPESLP